MRELPPPARLSLASVFSVAGLLTVVGVLQARPVVPDLAAAGLVVVLATAVQQFQVRSPKHQTYFLTTIFFVAGAVLLSPVELVAAVVLSHLVELLHARYRWYIQAFNIANFTIAGLVARVIYTVGQPATAAPGAGLVLRAAAAGLGFVLLNHLLTATVILLARRIPIKQAGTVSRENLSTDPALAALGTLAGPGWRTGPRRWAPR